MDSGRRDFSGLFGCWIEKGSLWGRRLCDLCVFTCLVLACFSSFPNSTMTLRYYFNQKHIESELEFQIKQFNIESAPY